ncbi:MAG: hypothetical protein OET79_02730, partial [Nitrospirota bacterium]|nr:hypothetical protein [Nitrospirota bacterium]
MTTGAYGTVREDGKASRTPLAAFFNISIIDYCFLGGMMNTRIAVLPGDGIGPEIMPQAVRV